MVLHSAALDQRRDRADTSIRMDQNTLTKREMDEMEAFGKFTATVAGQKAVVAMKKADKTIKYAKKVVKAIKDAKKVLKSTNTDVHLKKPVSAYLLLLKGKIEEIQKCIAAATRQVNLPDNSVSADLHGSGADTNQKEAFKQFKTKVAGQKAVKTLSLIHI